MTAVDLERPKALWGVLPQLRCDRIHPPPLAPPHHVPRALKLAHLVFALGLNHTRQLHREDAIGKGLVGRGKMSLLLEVLDALHY